MAMFVGRDRELAALRAELARLTDPRAGDRPGRALLIRGRRRVGKSRLVEQFIEQSHVPFVYFTASMQGDARELRLFAEQVASSDLPGADTFRDVVPATWEAALRLLAAALPADSPSIIVIDELPYLTADDPAFEGTLQKIFDTIIARRPALLIGIGSDIAMMAALNAYGRPFHQRAKEMIVPPLAPSEIGSLLALSPEDALDAFLVTGGLPLIADEWPTGASLPDYLESALSSPTSALVVSGERMLAAEFPADVQARRVLEAIGGGETTFSSIGRAAGNLQATSLTRSLKVLAEKQIIAVDLPLSTARSRERRYRVHDPYLRFWLTFVGPALPEIERGAHQRVLENWRRRWTSWRGRAIEPVIRTSLERMADSGPAGAAGQVGGYWTRSNRPEIDLVIADGRPATRVLGVGSIKWQERAPFDDADLADLVAKRGQLPGASETTPLIVVSRTGSSVSGVVHIAPSDIVSAW